MKGDKKSRHQLGSGWRKMAGREGDRLDERGRQEVRGGRTRDGLVRERLGERVGQKIEEAGGERGTGWASGQCELGDGDRPK